MIMKMPKRFSRPRTSAGNPANGLFRGRIADGDSIASCRSSADAPVKCTQRGETWLAQCPAPRAARRRDDGSAQSRCRQFAGHIGRAISWVESIGADRPTPIRPHVKDP